MQSSKFAISFIFLILSNTAFSQTNTQTPPCEPKGNVIPICNVNAPEDFERLPDGHHILISQIPGGNGLNTGGGLAVMNTVNDEIIPLAIKNEFKAGWGDADCIEPLTTLAPHGISLSSRPDGTIEILAVNHHHRESIERLELIKGAQGYSAIWRGCVLSRGGGMFNDVDGANDGNFVASIMIDRSLRTSADGFETMLSGENTGWLVEWNKDDGLKKLPESEAPFNNGIQLDHDGSSIIFAAWTAKQLRIYDRVKKRITHQIDLPFHPDNITQREDGTLIIAGIDELASWKSCVLAKSPFCQTGFTVVAFNSDSQKITPLFKAKPGLMSGASTALQVGNSLYIGTYSGDRMLKVIFAH